ncbi:MAG: tRNA (N6-threonylcarbamoyladenosine(37)-N6)-methyltransferase TrmO [Prevotella sp.]|nr:tRNA (N6-threonylcarbamoyladenosine(37)-N6)-methyltransferase TrmO [Prevotella sp.]
MKQIEPIAIFRSPFPSKFGIPRQSGLVEELRGRIIFEPKYCNPDALRGLESFDYIWLIWGFSANFGSTIRSTVRPPRLGGNKRIGVFATRSPFRPNGLGLSAVKFLKIEKGEIEVLSADLMDGTPIYDIKPYIPYTDSYPDSRGGFTDEHIWQKLQVKIPEEITVKFTTEQLQLLTKVLSLDPRPHYHKDPLRVYGMPFDGRDVKFRVSEGVLIVIDVL